MAASPRSLSSRPTSFAASRHVGAAPRAAVLAASALWALGCAGESKPPAAAPPSGAAQEEKAAPERDEKLPEGPLSKQAIESVIQARSDRFQPCYDAGLKKDPALRGKVMARIVIANDGYVASSEDAGSNMPDPGVVKCVLASFKKLRFPLPSESYVTFVYPMQFEAEQGENAMASTRQGSAGQGSAGQGASGQLLSSGPFRGCSVAEGSSSEREGMTTEIECGSRKLVVTDVRADASGRSAQQHLKRFEGAVASSARPKRSSPKLGGKASWVTVVQEKGKSWGTMVVMALGKEKTRVVECSGKPNGVSRWCERQIGALAKGFSPKGLLYSADSK